MSLACYRLPSRSCTSRIFHNVSFARSIKHKAKPKHVRQPITMDPKSQPDEDYTTWSTPSLIARITALESQLRAQNHAYTSTTTATPDTSAKKPPFKKPPKKPPKPFDPSKYSTRPIALKFAYLGSAYNGFEHHAGNTTPLPTVEEELWKAMSKTKLIFPDHKGGGREGEVSWEGCGYSKCGRTDRGVSAFGQVVGIRVRSNRPKERERKGKGDVVVNGVEETADVGGGDGPMPDLPATASDAESEVEIEAMPKWDPIADELPYIQLLNRVLPPDIKVLAWCPSPPHDFSARFSCKERRYRYFFTNPAFPPLPGSAAKNQGSAWLDIPAMQSAAQKLEGLHDFRNMCKIDASKQISNFERRIFKAGVHPVSADEEAGAFISRPPFAAESGNFVSSSVQPQLFYFEVCGSAFLWHQVRHMVAILFLVGQGYEDPSIVDELLDTQKNPSRPMYEMADDTPLVLWDCIFPDLSKVERDDHNRSSHESGYKDSLDWVYVGDSSGGRDLAKRPDASIGTGKYGRNGVMDDLWAQWRKRKMDEVLAGSLMDLVARQPMRATDGDAAVQPPDAESARVFDGSEMARPVGTYVPVMQRERMEPPEVVNERYAARKGLSGGKGGGASAGMEDMDE